MPTNTLKALSVRQPWAGLIVSGVKHVENRTWTTTHRGLLVIHAGARRDNNAPEEVQRTAADLTTTHSTGLLGLAVLTDVHPDAGCCRPWGEPGTFHWVLTTARPFINPIPAPGRLGLFTTELGA